MLRRSVSMLVMLGYLAGQLAAVPHAHAEDVQHEHQSAQPHLHLAAFGDSEHHHHHEHGLGNAHRHESITSKRESSSPGCRLHGATDHDEDAVYLPTPAFSTAASGADQSKLLTTPDLLHFVGGDPLIVALAAGDAASLRQPRGQAPFCADCLALRALRI